MTEGGQGSGPRLWTCKYPRARTCRGMQAGGWHAASTPYHATYAPG